MPLAGKPADKNPILLIFFIDLRIKMKHFTQPDDLNSDKKMRSQEEFKLPIPLIL
jgi:hypothetical protein